MTAPEPAHPRVAWAIHIFTAVGIIAGFLSLVSVLDHSPRGALTWMMVAMVIDGLDGPIARRYEIEKILPHFDGHIGDLIIDYVTTVIAPAFFIHEFHLLPRSFDLVGISMILLSAYYLFCNTHIMSVDNYFNGFPAMWNLVVTVMYVLQSPRMVNVVIVIVMSILTVVPFKFIHPIRVRDFRKITIPVLIVWLAALLYLTWILDDRTRHCQSDCLATDEKIAQAIVYLGAVWIVGVGVWRTFRGDPHPESVAVAS